MRISALGLIGLVLAGCSVISIDLTPRIRPLQEQTVEGQGYAKILLMDLSGFLDEEGASPAVAIGAQPPRVPTLVRIREELKKAAADDRVRALVLRINSPGGTVTASDIISREIEGFKANKRVPVVAVMMDVAASGGYYVALGADTIIAHPTTVTGSIGVIMITVNAQGLLEKIGVSASAIKSGPRKDMGSPFRHLTDEERAIFQSVIDELQNRFVAKVAERRNLPIAKARQIADGRIYTAEQAAQNGLIDQIGYVDDAIRAAKRAAGVGEAQVIVYHRPREYRATYYARADASAPRLDTALTQFALLLGGTGPRFLYLWWP
ncbi:MAG: signal peptide peptidase SppA [Candidatus Rokuibacteriota bacterium]|nr:MAG: signal peptide peptidase SppA [Candidatus Rokubacteria bacterium]